MCWRALSKFCDEPDPHILHSEATGIYRRGVFHEAHLTGAGQDFGDPLPDVKVADMRYRVQMVDSKIRRFDVCDEDPQESPMCIFHAPNASTR